MSITEKDVRHIARLARLRITPEEIELYRAQLGKILESMAELKSLDTADVPPTSHVPGPGDALREDAPAPFKDTEALLSAAPEREGPYFKVRKVIE